MQDERIPEIIFSDLCTEVELDGHLLIVEIYRTEDDPGWILEVENEFGTSTVMDDPPFLADGLAWRAFETLVREEGSVAFFTDKEKRRIRH